MTVTSTTWRLSVVLAMWVLLWCLPTQADGQHRLQGWSDQATIQPGKLGFARTPIRIVPFVPGLAVLAGILFKDP